MSRTGSRTSCIILDIGEAYTKCGFAGDHIPRRIVPTTFTSKHPLSRGLTPLTGPEWEVVLSKFLRHIYFECVQVNPCDRRVVLCENPFWPLAFKHALASVLFAMGVPGLVFMPAMPLPIYISGKSSGLIVDMGYCECRVLPVVEGFPVLSALRACPIGMADVHARARDEVKAEAKEQQDGAELTLQEVEDLVLQHCFVRASQAAAEAAEATMLLTHGRTLTISGQTRAGVCDTLFGDNDDAYNLASTIADCLQKCSVDARPLVTSNIVLCGGTSMLPGLPHRFLQEVNASLAARPVLSGLAQKCQLLKTPFSPHLHAFLGASLVGAVQVPDASFISSEDFSLGKPLPDWTNQHQATQAEDDEVKEPDALLIF